jgi:hypothetical protein
MAEPSTTSGVQPLTEAEQKTLDELTKRREDAAFAQAEEDRKARLAAMAPIETLLKLVNTDKVREACDSLVNDKAIDFTSKQLVTNFRQSLDYNLGTLATQLATLSTPAVRTAA